MSIKIISCHPIFNENALVLSNKYNFAIEQSFDPKAGDLYLVLGGHEIAHPLLEMQFRKNSSFGYVILNSEQKHSSFLKNKYYIKLMQNNVVCDFNNITPDYLKHTFGIKIFSNYFFEFMVFNKVYQEKQYDLVFVGSKNERREKLIQKLRDTFPNLKLFVDFEWKHKSPEDMTKLLDQASVVLNIPYYPENALETHRINKAIACHCDVISLKSCDEDANDFYKDYVYFCEENTLCEEVNKYFYSKQSISKKKYEELVKTLSEKISRHFIFVISQIHQKLLSLKNRDDVQNENVSQSIETTGDNTDQKTPDETTNQVLE